MHQPGLVAILGSGETSPTGRRALQLIGERLPASPTIAVLDSPAAFQPNSARVAEKVADFVALQLAPRNPLLRCVSTPREPDGAEARPDVLALLASAACIIAGPGSPSYMIRELAETPYVEAIRRAQQRGAALLLSSAAAAASGSLCLPVYEIFKAGFAPFWLNGLDLFRSFGLRIVVVPHWNNKEGGAELDTRFCYMGEARFLNLRGQLAADVVVLGIDEHTAAIMDFGEDHVRVTGKANVHVIRDGRVWEFAHGESFPLKLLREEGADLAPSVPASDLAVPPPSPTSATAAPEAAAPDAREGANEDVRADQADRLSDEFIAGLIEIRTKLRADGKWQLADELRDLLTGAGITVRDTPAGPTWERNADAPGGPAGR